MQPENNFAETTVPHRTDAPDESLRKINKLFLGESFTDHSGDITSGGDSQEVVPANANRRYLLFQNVSDAEMWIGVGDDDAVAGQPCIKIPAGGNYEPFVAPTDAIQVFCATTGKEFTCKEA